MSPMRIFISSTFTDLEIYRAVVHSAIQKMDGHAEDMVYWSADERAPAAASVARVRSSDLVILLVAHRYGTIPPGETQSIVELEYQAAIDNDIPVLAFFVDPAHPWRVDQTEADGEKRGRLEAFKTLVSRRGIREVFTDPQSLATLVTQAIHNWERRRNPPVAPSAPSPHKIVHALQRAQLNNFPDLVIPIGTTIHGLPLLGKVTRATDLFSPFNTLAAAVGKTIAEPPLSEWHSTLLAEARKVWCRRGLYTIDGEIHFVTTRTVASFGPTVVSRMLPEPGQSSVSAAPSSSGSPGEFTRMFNDASASARPAAVAAPPQPPGAPPTAQLQQYFGIEINNENSLVLWVAAGSTPKSRRRFVFESILGIRECRFVIEERRDFGNPTAIDSGHAPEFKQAVNKLFRRVKSDDLGRYTARFEVSRQVVGEVIVAVARNLGRLHSAGKIHGDLKPQNVLYGADGPLLFDSLDLTPGQLSSGVTPNWGAPEQVTQLPVSFATDMFALGLMIARLLEAKLAGEKVTYALPDGYETRIVKNPSLRNPLVTADGGNQAWNALAHRCLLLDPKERPSVAEFVETYETLLEQHPLPGEVGLAGVPLTDLSLASVDRAQAEVVRIETI